MPVPTPMLTPTDFDPYRAQIRGCECDLCYPMGYANRAADQRLRDAHALLVALRNGTHRHVTLAERAAIARRERAERIAAACRDGAAERRMAALIRGYATSRDRDTFPYGPAGPMAGADFVIGTGVGMSAGRYAAAHAAHAAHVERAERDRAATVARLIAADPRNTCVYFRFSGALCGHHAAHGTAPVAGPYVSRWAPDVLSAAA